MTAVASTSAAHATGQGHGVTVTDKAPTSVNWTESAYRGSVEVVRGADDTPDVLNGVVFNDRNRNSKRDADEPGIEGVVVSNGRDVVMTGDDGRYALPAYDNMVVFVTQPRGYQVPVDENNFAQFSYIHLPEGSPQMKYQGIPPTGDLPESVNFPLTKSRLTQSPWQQCIIGGDPQPLNSEQAGYAQLGAFADLQKRTGYAGCGALFMGDEASDDLSVYEDVRELVGMINGPARFLPGNHDINLDAPSNGHAFDTYRATFGPEYYSYDVGKAHFIALNNIRYNTATHKVAYGISDQQLEWLRRDIAQVPEDSFIVVAAHSPLLDFLWHTSAPQQNLKGIYQALEGRKVVALGGHTHVSENLRAGDKMPGWVNKIGNKGLPFTHLTVPAIAGQWFKGELLPGGYPTAMQQDGTPPGVMTLDIKNTDVYERFTPVGGDDSDQMALGLNTPRYRTWYDQYKDNRVGAPQLDKPLVLSRDELGDSWLTTNYWMGSTGSTVEVSLDGAAPVEAVRTQQLQGEKRFTGAAYSDPAAVLTQLSHGVRLLADSTMHLWRYDLPSDLAVGTHTATVTATDVYGRQFVETLTFEVTE
ncbi:calcineurin-like phosphoesterase family protein [Streptomyces sannanensis]|uniref:Calcineurin-like phosphoesterase family protein n=1 Tax=Streptomyces sannanensis TaxID=285536 RepID=A0ABP6S797_9ACTN